MKNNCTVCGIEFESVKPAKTCSPKCRVTLSRSGVTQDPNVTLAEPHVTLDVTFRFHTIQKAREPLKGQEKEDDTKSKVREAKYWYDVPLGAIPIINKDWPKIPEFMNGRQYFLWWKNNFQLNEDPEKGEIGSPLLLNPFPVHEDVKYEMGGETARRWGA